MVLPALNRRRTQLDVLAALCARSAAADLRLLDPSPADRTSPTRFRALDDTGLLLDRPPSLRAAIGARIEIRFRHENHYLGAIGVVQPAAGDDGALHLTLPPRFYVREARRATRVDLARGAPISATFTGVRDPAQCFTAELTTWSNNGIGATAETFALPALRRNDLYWLRFELPGDWQPCEFVVQIRHVRVEDRRVALGGAFCATDDPTLYAPHRQRVERHLLQFESAPAPELC